MAIIRAPHDQQTFQFLLPAETLRNNSLSSKARFLLSLCLSYSGNWCFNSIHLAKVTNWNRDTVNKYMRELIREGYISRIPNPRNNGRFQGYDYQICSKPIFKDKNQANEQEIKKIFTQPKIPALVSPEPKISALRYINTKIYKEERDTHGPAHTYTRGDPLTPVATAPKPPSLSLSKNPKIERAPHVFTTEPQHQQLLQIHGAGTLTKIYQAISQWKFDKQETNPSNWTKSKDYELARTWNLKPEKSVPKSQESQPEKPELVVHVESWKERKDFVRGKLHSVRAETQGALVVMPKRAGAEDVLVAWDDDDFYDILESAWKAQQLLLNGPNTPDSRTPKPEPAGPGVSMQVAV